MKIDDKIYSKLNSKTKKELIEEIITLKNGNGKSHKFGNVDINKSDELSSLIVENSHDGIIILGDNYKIEYVNNRLIELTGFQSEELLNKDFRKLLKSEQKKLAVDRYNARRQGFPLDPTFELQVITPPNNLKIFEVKSTLFTDYSGNRKTLSQLKDITERKLTEEVIKQSETKFRSIVETSHLGIIIVNDNFQFEYINEQFCKTLKANKEELEGADFRKFLSPESLDLVVDRYIRRQKGEDVPPDYEIKLLNNDGEERIGRLSSTTVKLDEQVKTIAQILDITEQVKKQKLEKVLLNISQAVNEVKNLSEFLGIVREELSSVLDTTNFYIAMYDENSDTYTFPYHVDEFDSIDEITQIQLKDSLTDYVRRSNRAVLVDAKMHSILEAEGEIRGVVGEACPVWIGAPLVVDNVVVGAICLQNYHNETAYNKDDLELLKIVSENVSSAIWKKQIVDKLTESELRYRDFITRSSEGIYRIDIDPPIKTTLPAKMQANQIIKLGTIGECNTSFAKMYGLKSNDGIIGKNLNVFYGNKISEENFNANLEFVKSKYKITDVETHEVSAHGEKLVILNNSIGIVKNGHLHNIWGIQKDITEQKKFQSALQKIAESISSSIDDSFFKSIVRFLGETLNVNYAFIAQLSEDGEAANSLAVWKNNKLVDNFRYQLKNSPSKFVIERGRTTLIYDVAKSYPNDPYLNKRKIKNYLGRPLINSEGKPIGIIVLLHRTDIQNIEFTKSVLEIFAARSAAEIERLQYVKEIVDAKDDAEKSNSLKSDFLAQMSHEIRTPVNTILSFTSLLKESLEDKLDEDLKDSFKIIENGGQRLIRTIDLILNVSQIQSGNLTLSPTKINLITVLKDLISEFKQSAHKQNLELNFESKHRVLWVHADNYTITQIFANLIHNSIKYTTKGSISVIAERNKNKEIVVKVKDTGVGMSAEYLTELFDPFSQEETGYTRKFEGTGLGLTLVRKYCELNNAKIKVRSKKNKGSTFIVKFKK